MAQKLNRQQARWLLYLSEFDVKLVHMPGMKMIQSDALSRRPDHGEGNEQDNDDMIMLPEGLFLKPYRFMDSKCYIIIFQKLPWQLLSMTS